MSATYTTSMDNDFLSAVFKATAIPNAASTNIALYTVMPTMPAGTGGTEVTGGGYARINVPSSSWGAPSGGSITNSGAAIVFAQATANYPADVVGYAVFASDNTTMRMACLLKGTNEVQSLVLGASASLGGTYTLSFSGQTTIAIPALSPATAVTEYLEALSTVGAGNVSVTGTTMTGTGGTYTITFGGSLQWASQALITIATGSLTGTSPTGSVTETTAGSTGAKSIRTNDQFSFPTSTLTVQCQ